MADGKRFYWLKLKRDFFKRHDIRIIEGMKNGKDYILFYLKLLCESVDHNGGLRFSEKIPYSEEMLATITDTNIDIVRSAVKVFTELGMMEIMDDGTFFMCEVQKMIGCETEWAEKKRQYREQLRQSEDNVLKLSESKKTMSDKSKSIDIEKETDKEIELNGGIEEPTAADELVAYAANNLQYLSPTNVEELDSFRDSLTDEMIRYAIDEACANGVRTYAYARKILNRMVERGFKSLGEVKAAEEERKAKQADKQTVERQVQAAQRSRKPMDERKYTDADFGNPLDDMMALMNRPRSGAGA